MNARGSWKLGLLAVAGLFLACGPSKSRMDALQRQNAQLRLDVQSAGAAAQATSAFAQQLEGKAAPTMWVLYSADDVARMSTQVLPHVIPARQLNGNLSGEVHVEKVTNVRFLPGNKLACQVHLRGVGVRVNAQIPKAYQAQVKRFLAGVASGVVTELDVTLTPSGNVLAARAVAKRSKMNRNSDRSNEAQLTNEMNATALQKGLGFDLTLEGSPYRVQHVGTTATHLVVGYGP